MLKNVWWRQVMPRHVIIMSASVIWLCLSDGLWLQRALLQSPNTHVTQVSAWIKHVIYTEMMELETQHTTRMLLFTRDVWRVPWFVFHDSCFMFHISCSMLHVTCCMLMSSLVCVCLSHAHCTAARLENSVIILYAQPGQRSVRSYSSPSPSPSSSRPHWYPTPIHPFASRSRCFLFRLNTVDSKHYNE